MIDNNVKKGSIFKTEANLTSVFGEIHALHLSISLKKLVDMSTFSANASWERLFFSRERFILLPNIPLSSCSSI